MSNRILLTLGAMAILGVLALLLVVVGKPPREIVPSSLSAKPGGALGLYRLLEAEGIPVKRWFEEPREDDPEVGAILVFVSDEQFSYFAEWHFRRREAELLPIVLRTPPELPSAQQMETVEVTAHVKALEGVSKVYKRSTATGRFRSGMLRQGNYAVVDAKFGTYPSAQIVVADGTMFLNQNLDQADTRASPLPWCAVCCRPARRSLSLSTSTG